MRRKRWSMPRRISARPKPTTAPCIPNPRNSFCVRRCEPGILHGTNDNGHEEPQDELLVAKLITIETLSIGPRLGICADARAERFMPAIAEAAALAEAAAEADIAAVA